MDDILGQATSTMKSQATSMMKSSSFHDLDMWRRHAGADGDEEQHSPPTPSNPAKHKSLKILQTIAPHLVAPSGDALSLSGALAATAASVGVSHACRLMIREWLPLISARGSSASRQTLELYVLSLLHSAGWVAYGLRALLRHGLHHHEGEAGTIRSLVLSAGYHVYLLLSLKSIWTHPEVTLQQLAELAGIVSQLRSSGIEWLVPLSGGLRWMPSLFLTSASALEHLGEPPNSSPFRLLRLGAAVSIVAAKAIATPMYLRSVLPSRPELHQHSMLPRKLVTAIDAVVSVTWLVSRYAKRRTDFGTVESIVVPQALAGLRELIRQFKMNAAAVVVTTALQLLYVIGPLGIPSLAVSAAMLPQARRRLRRALVVALSFLVGLAVMPLPNHSSKGLRKLLIRSGVMSLLKSYHSFKLIEEVPHEDLPEDRGLLYACVPHGVVPYGVILLWADMLEKGRSFGGLGASILFKLPVLRQFFVMFGLEPASGARLGARLARPGVGTFLVPGGIAEMFLNDPDIEVVHLANRKGFCKHALKAGAPILPVYIFGQTQLFFTLTGTLQTFMKRLSRTLRVSIIPFVGRSWLSPFVPLQKPLTVAIGKPINANASPVEDPSAEQVDALHTQFCSELKRIFETYKSEHPGFAHKQLRFAGASSDDTDLQAEEIEAVKERRVLEEFHLFPAKL